MKKKKKTKRKVIKKEVKKKKKLRKPYFSFSFRLVSLIILFIISFGTGIFFMIKSLNITHVENITYDEKGDINYSVCLNDNEFFTDKCLNKDMSYVASLINNIPLNFNYRFGLSDSKVIPKMEYEIIAKLIINDKDNNANYLEKKYILQDKTSNNITRDGNYYIINKEVNIDYDYYNSIANKFKSQYGIDSDSYLEVVLIAYNNVDSTYRIPSFGTTSIRIPLSQQSVQIKMTSNEININQNQVVFKNEFNVSNWVYLVTGITLSIISIIVIIKIIRKVRLIIRNTNEYDKKLNKILKEYDRVIVNTKTLPDKSLYCVMKIETFEELLDVRDNLRLPIMYYNVVNHQKSIFYILNGNNLYIYTLKKI